MKSTILATILVLLSSIGIGLGTGLASFKLGSESLKGVQSPLDSNTTSINGKELDELNLTQRKKFQIIDEKTILIQVYNHIQEQRQLNKKVAEN